MAKNSSNTIKWACAIIVIAGLFASIAGTWAVYGKSIEDNEKAVATKESKENVAELKKDGCDPARKHEGQMEVINYRFDRIDERQKEFTTEQKAMRKENETAFKEILMRLPE